jgi:dolichol-phosphate mannosyltransferase
MIQYSFVVPIYNDAYLAEDFCVEFDLVFRAYLNKESIHQDSELIFVSDGSNDESVQTLVKLIQKYPFVKVIELCRNFGQHIALSCGYVYASGEYVGMLNVDMQDPPNQIPLLLDKIRVTQCDIVYGTRQLRHSSFADRVTSALFNFLLNNLTAYKTPSNISTLRVMNRKFIDTYNSLSEKSRYLPGLEAWLGFKSTYVSIEHQPRKKGKSTYNFRKRMLMALDSVVSFSDLPLKFISILGILVALVGFFLTTLIILNKLFFIQYQPGYTSTISVIVFLGGIQIVVTGLAGLYIGRILKEVQNRPLYVIRNKFNF